MKLTTVDYGGNISWSLGSCQGANGYGNNEDEYIQKCCLIPGSYNLKCNAFSGAGWNGGYIEVYGTKYCGNFTSGSQEISEITIYAKGL